MPLSQTDYKRLHTFYRESLEQYGESDARAVQWADGSNQKKRFEMLLQIADLSNTKILDFGCGLGDLYKFFLQKQIPVDYTGIDIMPEFIGTALQRFPGTDFRCTDIHTISEQFDYVLASGAFSFKVSNNDDFYKTIIKKLYSLSNKGLAFNMLDSENHVDDAIYATYSASEIAAFCKTLSSHVEVIQGYLPQDFTLYMYKDTTL